VYEHAEVSGNVWAYDNAKMFGNAVATRKVATMNTIKHRITITDNHICIGCEQKTFEEWENWLASDEELQTPRRDPYFQQIRCTIEHIIEMHKLQQQTK